MAAHRNRPSRPPLVAVALVASLLGGCLPVTPAPAPSAAPTMAAATTATPTPAPPQPTATSALVATTPGAQPTAAPPGARTDVSVSAADLSYEGKGSQNLALPTIGTPLKARIHNNSAPGISVGVRVRFLVDGKTVDERPCFLAPGEAKVVGTTYIAPPWPFAHVEGGEDVFWPLSYQVIVDPENRIAESDETNNSAKITLKVACGQYTQRDKQDADQQPLAGEIAPMRDGISFEGLHDRQAMHQGFGFGVSYDLRRFAGSRVDANVRTYVYIDGELAQECRHRCPQSGFCYAGYNASYVRRSPVTVRFVFDAENDVLEPDEHNNELTVTVPVLAHDAAVGAADLRWSPSPVSAGRKLTLQATVHNTTGVPWVSRGDDWVEPAMRVRFLVDGQIVDEQYCDSTDLQHTYTAQYDVPAGRTAPLLFQVVLDPDDLVEEENEGNNEASVQIPVGAVPGESGVAFSIAPGDMGFAPQPLVPGEQVTLWAAPRNDSSALLPPGKALRVAFKVDGQVIGTETISRSSFLPQQRTLVQRQWRIPEGQVNDPVFEVVLDPDGALGEASPANNRAHIGLPLARPDLTVQESGLAALPDPPHFGEPVRLRAVVHNNGLRDAANCLVRFAIDGQTVGEQTVNLPALGMATAEVQWSAPASTVEAQPPVPLTGHSGWQPLPSPPRHAFNLAVTVDPAGAIAEADEANNHAQSTVTVVLPPNNRLVRAEVRDDTLGHLPAPPMAGVEVTLQAGAAQATARTDAEGRVSFEGVPVGSFTVRAATAGYRSAQTSGTLAGNTWTYDADTLYLNNRGQVSGIVTATPGGARLGGVLVGTAGYSTLSAQEGAAKGSYTLSLPPGQYSLHFEADGYTAQAQQVTVAPLGEVTLNVQLERTTLATVRGTVRDPSGNPVAGAQVTPALLNVAGNPTQPAAVTDSAGQYSLQVNTGDKMQQWCSFRATKQGLPSGEAMAEVVPGREHTVDIDMVPVAAGFNGTRTLSTDVNPWTILASMPDTWWNPEYNVEVVYGRFRLDAAVHMNGTTVTGIDLATAPDYWYYFSVSTKWDPKDVLAAAEEDIEEDSVKFIIALIPEVPIAGAGHSSNLTRVTVHRVAVVSHGSEVWAATPEAGDSANLTPGVDVDWSDCRIKFYLQVDPTGSLGDGDSFEPANPLAGVHKDKVLIVWNPRTLKITALGHYLRRWNDSTDRFEYTDIP